MEVDLPDITSNPKTLEFYSFTFALTPFGHDVVVIVVVTGVVEKCFQTSKFYFASYSSASSYSTSFFLLRFRLLRPPSTFHFHLHLPFPFHCHFPCVYFVCNCRCFALVFCFLNGLKGRLPVPGLVVRRRSSFLARTFKILFYYYNKT